MHGAIVGLAAAWTAVLTFVGQIDIDLRQAPLDNDMKPPWA